MQTGRGRRRGLNFTTRISEAERAAVEAERERVGGPRGLGPWLLWRALSGEAPRALPARVAMPAPATKDRVVLDLCGGTGAWSQPYWDAGYRVLIVDIAEDVRTYVPPLNVWGVLAAPPCTEFSIAKNGQPRDLVGGMACVNACMRIVLQARPRWWALENPTGLLGHFLGTPRYVFEPHEHGDPWTKRTAVWGDFEIPRRGPFVQPTGSAMDRRDPRERARTPPGFARAFFDANP